MAGCNDDGLQFCQNSIHASIFFLEDSALRLGTASKVSFRLCVPCGRRGRHRHQCRGRPRSRSPVLVFTLRENITFTSRNQAAEATSQTHER